MSYRFKLNTLDKRVIKLGYIPKAGETMLIYGKTYIIDSVRLRKANFYNMVVSEEIRTPVVIEAPKKKSFWSKILGR